MRHFSCLFPIAWEKRYVFRGVMGVQLFLTMTMAGEGENGKSNDQNSSRFLL
jgi:hypothetical protein